jgi:uncharacterized protein
MMKVFLFLALCGFLWIALRSLEPRSMYFPDKTVFATPKAYGLGYEDVDLMAQDGTKIHGWFIPSLKSKGPHPTLLFCHGNAGNISHRLDKVDLFYESGFDVLLFDYRGYGQSKGKPSENGTYQDAEAAYRYLIETRKLAPRKIVLYGESLGCAVAVETALKQSAGALILESPFTSTIAMGKLVFPWLPVKWLVKFHYDNLAKIPHLKMPILILHSPYDEIVPFSMGKILFASAPEPKTFAELRGGHNDGYEVSGPLYLTPIREFIKKNIAQKL